MERSCLPRCNKARSVSRGCRQPEAYRKTRCRLLETRALVEVAEVPEPQPQLGREATLGGDVVELPVVGKHGHDLPFAGTHRAVAFVLPEKRSRAVERTAVQRRPQIDTFHRMNRVALVLARILRASRRGHRRHDVDEMRGLLLDRAAPVRRDRPGPVHDER